MVKALGHAKAQEYTKTKLFEAIDGLAKFHEHADQGDRYEVVLEMRVGFEGDSDTDLHTGAELSGAALEAVADAEASAGWDRNKTRAHDNQVVYRVEIHSQVGEG